MKNPKVNDVPVDIYVRFVRSLFNDPVILIVGGVSHCLMALLFCREPAP